MRRRDRYTPRMPSVPARYLPLIEKMKFYVEPEISCSRFFGDACFTPESIAAYRSAPDASHTHLLVTSELGGVIAKHLRGGVFIDIPCGLHAVREAGVDFDVIPLAQALGAREAWEVDATADVIRDRVPGATDMLAGGYRFADEHGPSATRREGDMTVTTAQDDLLGFVAKLKRADKPLAIYVSALQPDAGALKDEHFQKDVAVPYLEALYDELDRVCATNDLVILNSSDMLAASIDERAFPQIHPALALPSRGFTLLRRDAYNKVNVFAKD